MSFGVMGGDMQPQGQTQIIVNRVDYGLEIQAAGDSPRWHHEGSSQAMGEDAPDLPATGLLRLESGVPEATRGRLAEMGWHDRRADGGFGRYQCVEHRMDGQAPGLRRRERDARGRLRARLLRLAHRAPKCSCMT